MRGNLAQANPILRRVEQLIYEADRLEGELRALLYQIEVNNERIPYLVGSVEIMTNSRVESQQHLVFLLNLITSLRNKFKRRLRSLRMFGEGFTKYKTRKSSVPLMLQ